MFAGRNAAGKGNEYAYQGVQPWIEGESEVRKHAYYQWVPFVLFLQGVMFYVPHYLWKIFEDRKVDKITNGLRGADLANLTSYFTKRIFREMSSLIFIRIPLFRNRKQEEHIMLIP